MRLETWTYTVQVTVDLDALGGWNPQDVADAIDTTVSQLEGVANVECKNGPKSYVACMEDSTAIHPRQG